MFGLEWNAAGHTLIITPNLPAQWETAKVSAVPLGDKRVNIELRRNRATMLVRLNGDGGKDTKLASRTPGAKLLNGELTIPLPAVEVGTCHGLPEPGSITSEMKVLEQRADLHSLSLRLSAPANSQQTLFVRLNDQKIHLRIKGGEMPAGSSELHVQFPAGEGYKEKQVTLSW
jgi:hypothetical protein